MPTIYQKYRPQKFADLIGQEHIVQTITNEIKNNNTAHAYLFFGARGIGKTTLARLLAKALNCEQRESGQSEPCGECSACKETSASRNIDVIEIDAASHTGVENVRENIIENAQFKPTRTKYKVFIVDEVHMLSTSAFNALLKTLEEPPAHVVFILATTELHKLPATIISRCERFNFQKISYDQMLKRLKIICDQEGIKMDKQVFEKIINKSDGCLRDAESLLGQVFSLNLKKITAEDAEIVLPSSNIQSIIKFLQNILENQGKQALDLLAGLSEQGTNLEQFSYDTIEILRLIMILQIDPTKNITVDYSEKDVKTIKKLSTQIKMPELINMLESLLIRRGQIKSAPIPQLPLELFVAEYGLIEISNPPEKQSQDREQAELKKEKSEPDPEPLKETSTKMTTKIKEKISSITSRKPVKTSLEQIKNKWTQIIENIAVNNHSLGFVLKMCEVRDLEKDGRLTLTVPFSLHKDKIEENQTRKIIEDNLKDNFGEPISICCKIGKIDDNQDENHDQEINDLAVDFGGEVVN
ncbi:MAG: DNA polymerase III subunit gamma/tau [bacterium]